MPDWLAERRGEVAADRILDAAEKLFTQHDPASIGMNEIARAAGCSRATLYRYFENREALRAAYVHRETYRLGRELMKQTGRIDDPHERLIASIVATLRMVRESPAMSSWFGSTRLPIGGELAGQSEVITALAAGFLNSLGAGRPSRRRTPGPLGGSGDHLAADVPRPRRRRRAGHDRGVRRADRGAGQGSQ